MWQWIIIPMVISIFLLLFAVIFLLPSIIEFVYFTFTLIRDNIRDAIDYWKRMEHLQRPAKNHEREEERRKEE